MASDAAFQPKRIRPALVYPRVPPHEAPRQRDRWRIAESRPSHDAAPPVARPMPRTEEAARRADALAVALRGALDLVTAPLARSAHAFVEAEGWSLLGYARLSDHARERFGRSGRWVRGLAALGRIFSTMPDLEAAVCGTDGCAPLGRVSGLLVGRVATAESLGAWVAHARRVTVRVLKRDVAAACDSGSPWPPGARAGHAEADIGRGGLHGIDAAAGNPEDETGERSLAGLELPSPVRAAFDEAVDLFRAVEGREATLTSFAEALVGDAAASGRLAELPAGSFLAGLSSGEAIAVREEAWARATDRWKSLPAPAATAWALRLAGSTLERLAAAADGAGRGDAVALDGQIRSLLAIENEIEIRLAVLMSQMADGGAWSRLGFDSAVHYAAERLGLRRSAARMRVRVARVIRTSPLLRRAYERGELGMEAAWIVSRMMGREPLDAAAAEVWVERARGACVKRLRDELRMAGRSAAGLQEHEDEEGGTASAHGDKIQAGHRRPASDAEWYRSLFRVAGTARSRIAALGRLAARRLRSDVFLSLRLPHDLATDFLGAIDAARRDLERKAASVPWQEDWPEPDASGSLRAAREFFVRCRRTPAWVGLLALLEDFAATWDVEANASMRPGARALFAAHGWRCAAPGCTSRRNLEAHHLLYRSRGGGDERENLLPVCEFHHLRGEHGGLASCRGRAPLGVTWTLGRGGSGGSFRNEISVQGC